MPLSVSSGEMNESPSGFRRYSFLTDWFDRNVPSGLEGSVKWLDIGSSHR